MADIVDSGSYGLRFPADSVISKLNLILADGSKQNLRDLTIEFSYIEDIYSFCASGHLIVADSRGFIEAFELTGNEFIEINFSKTKNDPDTDDQYFRVYKISDREPAKNGMSETYKIYFCSEEFLLSEQIKVSKSYMGTKISDIVNDILLNQMKVDPNNIDVVEETTGIYDFVVPRMKPLEAISWLSTYARPAGKPGSDMLFFETLNGFTFRSLQSMYETPTYGTYKFQPKNLDKSFTQTEDKLTTVIDYEIVKNHDVLHEISAGTYANKLISIDPLIRSYYTTNFDYTNYVKSATTLNGNSPTNYLKNRLGNLTNQSYDAVIKVATSNKDEINVPYIKNKGGAGIAKDIAIETYVPYRTAQLALANYTTLKIVIPGDNGITAGTPINFVLYSLDPGQDRTRNEDKFYSGKYLVSALRHTIQIPGTFETVLEIVKESTPNSFSTIQNDNQAIRDAASA